MTRRNFLFTSAGMVGGWLVDPSIARLIHSAAKSNRDIVPVAVENPRNVLTFDQEFNRFALNGECLADPSPLTWRTFVEMRNGDPEDPEALIELLRDYDLWEFDEEAGEEPPELPELDEQVPDGYGEDEYMSHWYNTLCPEAAAYHYLEALDLGSIVCPTLESAGTLIFLDADSPGADGYWVEPSDLAVVSGLQQRLIQLGEPTVVRLV